MSLKVVMDSLDSVDESYRKLYTEKEGKFVLTGVEGVKTQADVDRLSRAAALERDEHKKTKEKFKPFEAFVDSADEVLAKLDKYGELEAAAAGKLDESKINEMVEGRIKSRLSPLERKAKTLEDENTTLKGRLEQMEAEDKRRRVHDAVREAATKSKMIDTAVEDALVLAERMFVVTEDGRITTKEGVGVTPDSDPTVWLTEMQQKRPHWWPESKGAGARPGKDGGPGGLSNPWTHEGWNMTEQGRMYNENPERAERLAQSAGTTIGGPKPRPKN